MRRRTKIVTTLGPSTDKNDNLEKVIQAGANVVRLNFSHGTAEDHIRRAEQVRNIAAGLGIHIGILGDLQGPKIRVSTFKEGKVQLSIGNDFTLDSDLTPGQGDEKAVGLDYKELPKDVDAGDILLLDDGRVQLEVTDVEGNKVKTKVVVGGPLSNNKGINKLGGGLSAEALTLKDKADIITAAKIDVDYLAVSFPRNGDDMRYARQLAKDAGLNALLCAKIERAEVVADDESIDDVIFASDSVMVARGDLGVEIGDPELVGKQKKIIERARMHNRTVITATQMMESMITNPMPTRAEVMDVANAVLDGTDAVMLSAETAAGSYPSETVVAMASVCLGAEKHPTARHPHHNMEMLFDSADEATAISAIQTANRLRDVKAIIALTKSGRTPLLMSRISSALPILGMSRFESTLRQMALYRGVKPIFFNTQEYTEDTLTRGVLDYLMETQILNKNDMVIMTKGDLQDKAGATNTVKILRV